ncbi:MAG TPA: polysaccharide biosynthesis/export family protein [Desulfatiglandales bacterium]|nr:polysaccharide biosynthesis/export family protein [Desulfatiglandales bacterium]
MKVKIRDHALIYLVSLTMFFSGVLFSQEQFVTEYRMGPKDLLEITVIGFEDLNRQYRISEDGKIGLPYLGDVEVQGLTKSELEKRLAELLKEKYLENPQVTVVIVEHQSRKVYLIGAVTTPGPYDLMGRLTLLKLISQAGGLSANAGSEIIIIRLLPDGSKTSLKISVEDLILKGDASLDIPLQPEDIISIPVDKIVQIYVTGQVRTPGALSVRKSNIPTLLRSIAQAGGFAERASKRSVIIKRIEESGKEIKIQANVDDIIKGKSKDIQLQENDIVIVPEKLF